MKTLCCDGCGKIFVLKEKSNQQTLKAKGIKVYCSRICRERQNLQRINERARKNYYRRKAEKAQKNPESVFLLFHRLVKL